jgi:hypothetical protein
MLIAAAQRTDKKRHSHRIGLKNITETFGLGITNFLSDPQLVGHYCSFDKEVWSSNPIRVKQHKKR